MIDNKAQQLVQQFKAAGVRVKYDDTDNARPGWKFAQYEMQGIPIRIAIGARDIENNVAEVARRDTKIKQSISLDTLPSFIPELLQDIQQQMYNKAKAYLDDHITPVDTWGDFEKILEEKGGFISAHWDGTAETEEKIKQLTKAAIRCIPLDNKKENGKCVLTGKPSLERVLFARAY